MRAAPVFYLALLIFWGSAQAVDSEVFDLNIESERLDFALIDLSTLAHVAITVDAAARAKRFISPKLIGPFTLEEALTKLLACTQLRVVKTGERGYEVRGGGKRCEPPRPPDLGNGLETIMVTGTIIRNTPVKDAAITTYSPADLGLNFGAITIDQLTRRVFQNFSLVNSQTSTAANANPVAGNNIGRGDGFDLLGISPNANLILFNGHRLAPGGYDGSTVDVSLLPWFTMEKLDVLVGGASATYGSDAVSGVVNLVPRYNFEGAETTLYYGDTTRGEGGITGISQLFGHQWSDKSGVMLGYQHQQQEAIDASTRQTLVAEPASSQIIPSQRSNSVVLTSRKTFSGGGMLSGDAFYSRRDFGQEYLSNPVIHSDGNARMWDGSVNADIALQADWHTRVIGTYVRDDDTVNTSAALDAQTLRTHSTMGSADWSVGGPVPSFWGEPLEVWLGGAWRREAFSVESAGQHITPTHSGSWRAVWSSYAEFSAPLIGADNSLPWAKRIQLRAAWRRDSYHNSDSGIANISSNNPTTVGLLWSPVSELTLRAIYATAFRPAPLYDTERSTVAAEIIELQNPKYPNEAYDTLYVTGGNPALHPELAQSYTAGFDLQPKWMPGLSISFSYEHVDYHNRVAAPPVVGDVGNIYSQLNTLAPFINVTPSKSDIDSWYARSTVYDPKRLGASAIRGIFDSTLQNIAATRASAMELQIKSKVKTDFGDFDSHFQGQYLMQLKNQAASTTPFTPLLNTDFNAPRVRLQSGASWTKWGWSVSGDADFTGSYRDNWLTSGAEVASWLVFNGCLSYTTAEHGSFRLLDDTTFALSVDNIADRPVPSVNGLSGTTQGYDPSNATALGRVVWVIFRKNF